MNTKFGKIFETPEELQQLEDSQEEIFRRIIENFRNIWNECQENGKKTADFESIFEIIKNSIKNCRKFNEAIFIVRFIANNLI